MAIPATPTSPPAVTTAEALALDLMADGFSADDIRLRTEIAPDDLYRLAALHNVPSPHGTIEGFGCHRARREQPSEKCAPLEARCEAQFRARQRIADAERTLGRQHRTRRGRRNTLARA
ncbi:hypothetical protein [Streptomyces malaysiensis]|uniref:Uncharacterized protein n=1 Tax=Streptomyces malaysiensis subsp. samsunensis TaxID=459658 RepID=A0A9X2M2F8_STRMQ|nr:hypothetical protein [Streptomyces samsunensis]MCQ8833783.1 hypothetical protein [Streptomyces samsunensis]